MLSAALWAKSMLGTDFYHIAASFVLYSMLGWLAESVYMSFCEKKITNRGFAKGPFCPIYGFGATFGNLFLQPVAHSFFLVYVIGAIAATVFEYIAAIIMIKCLGSLWWDYNEKPYNYKGILCLESTLGWGFYAIGVVEFLHPWLMRQVDSAVSVVRGKEIILIIMLIAVIDYIIQLSKIFREPIGRLRTNVATAYRNFMDRR